MDSRVWHYVKRNETTRVPRRHVFIDTEAVSDRVSGGHEQHWALGVACFSRTRKGKRYNDQWRTYDDPIILWREVDAFCGQGHRVILWAHNLGYDARVAEAFTILPDMGWKLVGHNLSGKGMWLTWRKDKATLVMVDSAAVFPTTLAQVGKTLRMGKLALPDVNAGGVGLYSRCWRDVEILRAAVINYLQWIETEDLGNWQLTGAGQSWAAFRHKFMDRRLLVHDDVDALAAERRAMWTGRCEAYWHGQLNSQVVHEWDFSLAYPRIAATEAVPVRLLGIAPGGYDWQRAVAGGRTAFLAEATVTTSLPVVPTVDDGRVLWPVGTFDTTLWDVELQAAIDAGATVTIHRGWLYHKAPALQKWAQWIIEQLESIKDGDADWRYTILKHWARALIGRFAMTYMDYEEYATAPTTDVRMYDQYDLDTGATDRIVQVGHTLWRQAGTKEWGESMPMVTGYVQAIARVRLWRVLSAAPDRSVLYADTDSVLVTDSHSSDLAAIAATHPDWGLRLKRSWQGFAIWGPRQIRTGQQVRVAGIPRAARQTGRDEFVGEVWQSVAGAMHTGSPNRVIIRDRAWKLRGVDRRRDGPGLGWTHPYEIGRIINERVSSDRVDARRRADSGGDRGVDQRGVGASGGSDRRVRGRRAGDVGGEQNRRTRPGGAGELARSTR